jgi:DNA-binding transcriptional regulator YiaG
MTADEFAAKRSHLGLSQSELAERLGVHVRTIGKWERGERGIPEPVARLLATIRPVQRKAGGTRKPKR